MLFDASTSDGSWPAEIGHEPFRPQFHFSARRNWLNDPNGLVYFEGEYHLFFQYNPLGKDWGNMCWGHAVSPDLLYWHEIAVAIPETDQMIFSGSVVVDWQDTSGLGDGQHPPLLAYFTAFDPVHLIQSQHLAYSHDHGRSFMHYHANPIIDLDMADFRDPKVFHHAESAAWIMVLALSRQHVIQFYRSQNLRDWTLAGTFCNAGAVSGQWECPDLVLVPVAGGNGEAHWILKIDVDAGFLDGGSGAQYFVGDFDGFTFTIDRERGNPEGDIVDFGPDFYAAVTWSDLPTSQPGPVWIGWQSNHQSGKVYPTDPWRGAMSLPRTLFLYEERGRLRLGQKPIASVESLRVASAVRPAQTLAAGGSVKLPSVGRAFEQQLTLGGDGQARIALLMCDDGGAIMTIIVDFGRQRIEFTRNESALVESAVFARAVDVPVSILEKVNLRIFFDGSLLEVFVNEGVFVYSGCLFPVGLLKLEIADLTGVVDIASAVSSAMKRSIRY